MVGRFVRQPGRDPLRVASWLAFRKRGSLGRRGGCSLPEARRMERFREGVEPACL